MKRITRLSLALMMFSLFSISHFVRTGNAQTLDPGKTMQSETVDLTKQTLQLHKRIAELEAEINDEIMKREKHYSSAVECILSVRMPNALARGIYKQIRHCIPDVKCKLNVKDFIKGCTYDK